MPKVRTHPPNFVMIGEHRANGPFPYTECIIQTSLERREIMKQIFWVVKPSPQSGGWASWQEVPSNHFQGPPRVCHASGTPFPWTTLLQLAVDVVGIVDLIAQTRLLTARCPSLTRIGGGGGVACCCWPRAVAWPKLMLILDLLCLI